jgi:hypothetical protein
MTYPKVLSMQRLCKYSEFGPTLFDMLTPMDLRAFQYAFGITLTRRQTEKYMQLWRQFFSNKDWIYYMLELGLKATLVGADLIMLINLIRNPYYLKARRVMHINLALHWCKGWHNHDSLVRFLAIAENLIPVLKSTNMGHYTWSDVGVNCEPLWGYTGTTYSLPAPTCCTIELDVRIITTYFSIEEDYNFALHTKIPDGLIISAQSASKAMQTWKDTEVLCRELQKDQGNLRGGVWLDMLDPIHMYAYVLRGMPKLMPALAMRESTPTEMGTEIMWHYMNLDCTNMLISRF